MLALNCAAHKASVMMEKAMLNKEIECISDGKEEKFVVRLPTGMRTRVRKIAKANHRSMNAEIVNRIDSSLRQDLEILRLKAVIDMLLKGGEPASNVLQLPEAGQ
ncbi:Arc family DNA-binding protein [Pseudomonas sp. CDFA 550]|uniref:Arc family DNA-binding protein n=1 Tax=Pseudomonas quasicaspiana TaxID=2829821 RepID=UPI001E641A3F|nr:Arc family DNA-binding protein [Pseudomonas quasicaspiana]MCD5972582.1 Arc family DNA-binding protein [Pseudomonas quasicaspiana]